MDMKDVKSSQIAAVGHNPQTNTLAVRFNNGGTYHYHDVPREKFEAFMNAKSKGKYLHAHVKPHHKFSKVVTS